MEGLNLFTGNLKKLIIFVLILFCCACLFAEDWSFSTQVGYGVQSCKPQDNRSTAMNFGISARRVFDENVDIYGDFNFHFGGNFKYLNREDFSSLKGFNSHICLLYKIPLRYRKSYDFSLGSGFGLARSVGSEYENSEKVTRGFTNFGISFTGIARIKFKEHFALFAELTPDFYFINVDTSKQNNSTVSTRLAKLGLGFNALIGLSYYI